MKISERFKAAVQTFRKTENVMGTDISRSFLRYGDKKALVQDWSKVIMNDKDLYTGYPYAAINNRANKVAQLANEDLKTDATDAIMKAAKAKDEVIIHPYLEVIDKSKTFSNNKFWYDISTFLDLEGVYYLFVLRTITEDRVGNPLEFKLLNPYDMRRIINKDTLEVGGYVEARDGMVREFNPKAIIEIRKLNPFSTDDPFAMTDAAKESQYTIKQAGDYTRHSLKNNMAAPGIISTDVLLDTEQFTNFVSRVTNQEKGLPLFGNGAGAITWDSMQIDMDKAALDKINEINRQTLFAVSGVGKTMMAIEESGTTRDTAKVQKDLFVENHVMPQLQLIIDALNQDYKIYYEGEYTKNKYTIYIDNPLGSDREAELKDIEIRDESYKVYDKLVADGYKRELASKYAQGEITLEELGEPTEEPRPNPIIEAAKLKIGDNPSNPNIEPPKKDDKKDDKKKPPKPKKEEAHDHEHLPAIKNEFDEESQGLVQQQQAALQNVVVQVEGRVVSDVLNRLTKAKNAFEDESDIISKQEKKDATQELELALATFYLILLPIYASSTTSKRAKEFGGFTNFKITAEIKKYVKEISKKVSESHIDTILEDLRLTVKKTYDANVEAELKKITGGRKPTDADLRLARKKALEGASQQNIINAVKKEYADEISQARAKAIARTETNRAFTQSQYQADLQFIKQNNLEGQAYKKWTTRSSNPCAICQSLANQPPIPFETNFANLGDELTATYKDEKGRTKVQKQLVNFEPLEAGNAHTNCSCRYILIIE